MTDDHRDDLDDLDAIYAEHDERIRKRETEGSARVQLALLRCRLLATLGPTFAEALKH